MVYVYASEDGTNEKLVAEGKDAMACLEKLIDELNKDKIDLNTLSLRATKVKRLTDED